MNEQQQYPTREQIIDAITCGNPYSVMDYEAEMADRILALFPQPTPSAEPRMTCGEPRPHDAHEGDTGFGDEPDIDWVHWKCPGVPLAVPPSIADMTPGTTFEYPARWQVGAHRTASGRKVAHMIGLVGTVAWIDELDPATIRDVTPPESPNAH